MRILITGANGMVARAVAAHCRALGDEAIALSHRDLDISDRENVYRSVNEHLPDIVFNCAAFTDVDRAETQHATACAVNAAGPENLAAASRECGATFLTISTDYVFDGTKDGFYTAKDIPNPQSVYARSKYEGELRSMAANPDSIVVRSGWIFGRGGTNFLSAVPGHLSSGKTVNAIKDSFGTPTFANDLAVRMRELAVQKAKGVIHAVNSGSGTSYLDFVIAVAEGLGIADADVNGIYESKLDRTAARPRNSRLLCTEMSEIGLAPLRDWKAGLAEFLSGRR